MAGNPLYVCLPAFVMVCVCLHLFIVPVVMPSFISKMITGMKSLVVTVIMNYKKWTSSKSELNSNQPLMHVIKY